MLHPIEILHFVATLWNRPPRSLEESSFWQLYEQDGQTLTSAPDELKGCANSELLIVITTYQRPQACAALISELASALEQAQLTGAASVLVFNDRGDADYAPVREFARKRFGTRLVWLDARRRLGKPGFWMTYQTAFLAARRLDPAHALFLQDDLELAPDFFAEIRRHWARTAQDPLRRVLYLFSSDQDERWGRWVLYRRREVAAGLRLTQWFDLQAFYVDRAFFELLQYVMIPIHQNRWRRTPNISSGVGKQLTVRLRRRGHIYQAYPPLVFHGAHASEMNPGARARRALDNRALLGGRDSSG